MSSGAERPASYISTSIPKRTARTPTASKTVLVHAAVCWFHARPCYSPPTSSNHPHFTQITLYLNLTAPRWRRPWCRLLVVAVELQARVRARAVNRSRLRLSLASDLLLGQRAQSRQTFLPYYAAPRRARPRTCCGVGRGAAVSMSLMMRAAAWDARLECRRAMSHLERLRRSCPPGRPCALRITIAEVIDSVEDVHGPPVPELQVRDTTLIIDGV